MRAGSWRALAVSTLSVLSGCLIDWGTWRELREELSDADGDGWTIRRGDCDDEDAATSPDAAELWYDGLDSDCQGDDDYDADHDGDRALSAGGGDCDDQDPLVSSLAEESWAVGFQDGDCDGALGEVRDRLGDRLFLGRSAGSWAGYAVAPLGALTPEGGFLVGAAHDDARFEEGGAVLLALGDQGGDLGEAVALEADAAGLLLGAALDGGADVDGDGLPDLLVAGPGRASSRGAAWLVSGEALLQYGTGSAEGRKRARMDGPESGAQAGIAVRFVGDLDGDGLEDVAIGAPSAGDGGAVALFSAETLLAEDQLAWEDADGLLTSGVAGMDAGRSVFSPGDVTGDGTAELIVGGREVAVVAEVRFRDLSLEGAAVGQVDAGHAARFAPAADLAGQGLGGLVVLDDQAWIFDALEGSQALRDALAVVSFPDDATLSDALPLGDLDGDGLGETALTGADVGGQGWIGLLEGADPREKHALEAEDLRLQATGDLGFGASLAASTLGDGSRWLLLGSWVHSQAGVEAGAAALLPVPR